MTVLIIGSGGREHALAWKLAQEAEVHIAPGNPGTAQVGTNHPANSVAEWVALAEQLHPDLVVVGPEDPLIDGLADELRARSFHVYGPGRVAAQLEGSKAFSKAMMEEAGIPTAKFRTVTTLAEASEWISHRFAAGKQVAVKASGAALGKGVVVCETEEAALQAAEDMLSGSLGEAGKTLVIEDRLRGREFSLLTLCGRDGYQSLPIAQDYKRIFDNDEGGNTGGMGTYSPVSWVDEPLVDAAEDRIVMPLLHHLKRVGIPYIGTLFSGIMLDESEPYCLEYNVRFGDPETQSVMLRIGNLLPALYACSRGEAMPKIEVLENHVVTVVLASRGYPASSEKGVPITLGEMPEGVQVFHAGTALKDGVLVTNGGRVLAVTASASNPEEARALAYEGASRIEFAGKQLRTDIAKP